MSVLHFWGKIVVNWRHPVGGPEGVTWELGITYFFAGK